MVSSDYIHEDYMTALSNSRKLVGRTYLQCCPRSSTASFTQDTQSAIFTRFGINPFNQFFVILLKNIFSRCLNWFIGLSQNKDMSYDTMHAFENSVEKILHHKQEIRVPNGHSIKKPTYSLSKKSWKTNRDILCNVDIRFPTFRISG